MISARRYDIPILFNDHAAFIKREAAHRYKGTLVQPATSTIASTGTTDSLCVSIFTVEDRDGLQHTDYVLQALTLYEADMTESDRPNGST